MTLNLPFKENAVNRLCDICMSKLADESSVMLLIKDGVVTVFRIPKDISRVVFLRL